MFQQVQVKEKRKIFAADCKKQSEISEKGKRKGKEESTEIAANKLVS